MTRVGRPHGPPWADAYATAAFVMGETGLAWVHGFEGYTALGIRPDGTIVTL